LGGSTREEGRARGGVRQREPDGIVKKMVTSGIAIDAWDSKKGPFKEKTF